ncbi:MAG: 3-dehydroquinate synthase [Candidatus Enteromonas sp.]|nr:3-dehydroquinate synthase [Candidatus Enteromonas sp.]
MKISVHASRPYNIHIERGLAAMIPHLLGIHSKSLILTDSGVPSIYAESLQKRIPNSLIFVIPEGEKSKSSDSFLKILSFLVANHFSRKDCLISLGGGVVGDLGGFVASTYMRGIAFYNIPTTLLSMVDSSIGGKTGIDFEGYKNIVGSFYPPKAVFIDPDYLSTLDKRQFAAGFAEIVKMAATLDKDFFDEIKAGTLPIEIQIEKALRIKKKVVEEDEKESGIRKVLNFGHTLGHAYEVCGDGRFLHGEAIAMGMLPFSSPEVREEIQNVLIQNRLPIDPSIDVARIETAIRHDKKGDGETVDAVFCPILGKYEIKKCSISEILSYHKEVFQ